MGVFARMGRLAESPGRQARAPETFHHPVPQAREPSHLDTTMHLSLAQADARLPTPDGKRFVELFTHGTLAVELYAPRGTDPQQPHTRDEVYVVARGSGTFFDGEKRVWFLPGDFLFVPASVPHRFEDFTEDLAVWVMFYGPEGGEQSVLPTISPAS